MKVINDIDEMRGWSKKQRAANKVIGFVPTMGYLHEGHLSLIKRAKELSDVTVVSIYVNPAQFAPNEDYDRYPRDLKKDHERCNAEGVAAIFQPSNATMYADNHKTYIVSEEISQQLCGISRPTHFRGVTTIVAKLFNIIQPHYAVFGQKDAQQALIIRKMAADLNFDVKIEVAPTFREKDGLAMSSRNKYLTDAQRREATILYRSLLLAKDLFSRGNHDLTAMEKSMRNLIGSESGARIDYIECVNARTLGPAQPDQEETLVALAVFFDKTRLIDNIILPPAKTLK